MNVIYNDIIEIQNCPEGCKAVTVEELISTADFISLHMPGTNGKPIIGKEEFEKMKNGVYILNLARGGGIIDEEALIQALDSGKVAAAALDVFEEEPIKMKDYINMKNSINSSYWRFNNRSSKKNWRRDSVYNQRRT